MPKGENIYRYAQNGVHSGTRGTSPISLAISPSHKNDKAAKFPRRPLAIGARFASRDISLLPVAASP